MKILTTLFLISLSTVSQGQFFKTIGFKTGITRSYFTWDYKPNSTATFEGHDKSDKALGMVFLLTGDIIDKKYWSLNLSTGWLQRNGKVDYTTYFMGQTGSDVAKYKTSYLTLNPGFKGKLPVGKSASFYGQLGLRADYLLGHPKSIEYYPLYPYGWRIQEKSDIQKMNYGMTWALGLEKSFDKLIFRIEYTRLINFNKIIDVTGPRRDGYGDEGFFLKMNSFTGMYTLNLAFKL